MKKKNPKKKNVVIHYVKKANQLAQAQQGLVKEQESLTGKIAEAARGATLDVPDVAFARTKVRIGTVEVHTELDVSGVQFRLDKDSRIVQGALNKKLTVG